VEDILTPEGQVENKWWKQKDHPGRRSRICKDKELRLHVSWIRGTERGPFFFWNNGMEQKINKVQNIAVICADSRLRPSTFQSELCSLLVEGFM
jgi:hypothetical protein